MGSPSPESVRLFWEYMKPWAEERMREATRDYARQLRNKRKARRRNG